ncbi:enoyl-CoA hydratase/isomerase family protein [Mesorhizobium sp. YR577]|uniref:enoyl-CoA hydratase/isomerase family protein n=1 Tax=Mesorhizobium sp. YR577 TaxID=1884373 RepID=UPI0008EECA79|nr:enoyl-CoA hydratase/isomerase family protein [Mesorhizobium sp. YR577]SFU22675.1 Enoyl-CoA hydratase/carnithine racemase [Mesorhizobium sp. YR577]
MNINAKLACPETETLPAFGEIRASLENSIGRLLLARPDRGNALNPVMVRELSHGFQALLQAGAHLVVISGEGKHFCTGFDLSDLDQCSDGDLLLRFVEIEALLQMLHRSTIPTLAVGKGRVVGAGADLFVACDRRLAAEGTTFAFPGAGFGLVLGTDRLRALIGRDHARRIVTQGETVDAQGALALGLATEIASDDHVDGITSAIVERITALGPTTVAALHDATAEGSADTQLAALVRSAARPHLKQRIEAYKARVAGRKAAPIR